MFIEVSENAGVAYRGQSFGASWGDYNGDGFDDLWVTNHGFTGQLFVNQRDGSFTEISNPFRERSGFRDEHGAAWADFDNDGDSDLLQTFGGAGTNGSPNSFYININGELINEASARGLEYRKGRGRSAVWVDYNGDGLLDVFLANLARAERDAPPKLFLQTPDNNFVDVSNAVGIGVAASSTAVLADLTGDGKLDLISRGFDPTNRFERLTIYDMSSAPFENVVDQLLPRGLNATDFAVGDFNNDLLTDLFIADSSGDRLFLNNGQQLIDVSEAAGIITDSSLGESESVVAGDIDNDMDIDIYVLKGANSENPPNILYENQGDGTFVIASGPDSAPGTSEGRADTVIISDYDRDGFLDLFTTNGIEDSGPYGPSQLFRNQGNSNNWIELNLIGLISNMDGIGARVFITAGGITQLREQNGGVHKISQDSSTIHVGLGSNAVIDEIRIEWPSGIEQILTDVPVNQYLDIRESEDGLEPLPLPDPVIPLPDPNTASAQLFLVGAAQPPITLIDQSNFNQLQFSIENLNTEGVSAVKIFRIEPTSGSTERSLLGEFSVLESNEQLADFSPTFTLDNLSDRETIQVTLVKADGTQIVGQPESIRQDAAVLDFSGTLLTLTTDVSDSTPGDRLLEADASGNEKINLTAIADSLTATFTVYREAALDSTLGFYVTDGDGGVDDPVTGARLLPGDQGYQQAAMANRLDLSLTGTNGKATVVTDIVIEAGGYLSAFLIAGGDNPLTNEVFFSHAGANSDGLDHTKLLGDNTFGFEDILGLGDADFNDLVVSITFG